MANGNNTNKLETWKLFWKSGKMENSIYNGKIPFKLINPKTLLIINIKNKGII